MSVFIFTEEHEAFRREVRSFAQAELAEGANECAKCDSIPYEIARKMADAGYTNLGLPKKYGGRPSDWITQGIACEEISKADFNVAILMQHTRLIEMILQIEGTSEELQEEWLPSIGNATKIGSAAVTEPHCGSDVRAIKTTATREGHNYIINGQKTSVFRGIHADFCVVLAKTDPTAGLRGMSLFFVPLDSPGVSRSRHPDMGIKPGGRASITFNNVVIPDKYRMGKEGVGFRAMLEEFNISRTQLALQTLGPAERSLEETITYVKQRVAFGNPLAKYEAISFKIAEAATFIEAGRWLCYRSLWLKDQGLPNAKEAGMAKWLCPKTALRIIHDCLLIHGNLGYTDDLPFEQRLRDVIGFEFADGTSEICKLTIAREIIGKEAIPY